LDKPAINQVRVPKLMLKRRAIGSLCLVATATGWAFGWSAMKLLMGDWPPLFSRGVAGVAASLSAFSSALIPLKVSSSRRRNYLYFSVDYFAPLYGRARIRLKSARRCRTGRGAFRQCHARRLCGAKFWRLPERGGGFIDALHLKLAVQQAAILTSPLHDLTGFYLAVDCVEPGAVGDVQHRMRCSGRCGGPVA
jgi:hypothetical protein